MKASALLPYVRDTLLRMLPHRARTGLVRIENPTRKSPVLLTANFTLTVRRVVEALAGHDVWLLVADSKGINVWCAAGGGHLTHHDVVSVIRTSGIGELVDHRELVLPQLAATGVEPGKVREATGWKPRWGPVRLEDLPAYLDRGGGVHPHERLARFPPWERLEMALTWAVWIVGIAAPLCALIGGWKAGLVVATVVVLAISGIFLGLPWLPVTGRARWLTYAGFAALAAVMGAGLLSLLGAVTPVTLTTVGVASVLGMAVLSIDLTGATPLFPSSINTLGNQAAVDLDADRCTGAAACVQVCPRGVLEMNGRARKVEISRPDDCIQCGACIVQCPEDALRFRYQDGRLVEAVTIRRTRMNMLGRRTIPLEDARA